VPPAALLSASVHVVPNPVSNIVEDLLRASSRVKRDRILRFASVGVEQVSATKFSNARASSLPLSVVSWFAEAFLVVGCDAIRFLLDS